MPPERSSGPLQKLTASFAALACLSGVPACKDDAEEKAPDAEAAALTASKTNNSIKICLDPVPSRIPSFEDKTKFFNVKVTQDGVKFCVEFVLAKPSTSSADAEKRKALENNLADETMYTIPRFVMEKFPDFIKLIYETKSMGTEEREYWMQIMPIMTEENIVRLRNFLINEKETLAKLDQERKAQKRQNEAFFKIGRDHANATDQAYHEHRQKVEEAKKAEAARKAIAADVKSGSADGTDDPSEPKKEGKDPILQKPKKPNWLK